MGTRKHASDILNYSRSARGDLRAWAMLVGGVVFMLAGRLVNPLENCSESGECAPWLIPLAFVAGAAVGLGGLAQLLANPKRGSRIDPESGALVWWQNRFGDSECGGDAGQIDPANISLIRIIVRSEGSNEVHLYDINGERQFFFDEEVVPWDQQGWAKAMTLRWPHIRIELVE